MICVCRVSFFLRCRIQHSDIYLPHGHRNHLLRQIEAFGHVADLLPLVKVELAGEYEIVDPVAARVLPHDLLGLFAVDVVAINGLTA